MFQVPQFCELESERNQKQTFWNLNIHTHTHTRVIASICCNFFSVFVYYIRRTRAIAWWRHFPNVNVYDFYQGNFANVWFESTLPQKNRTQQSFVAVFVCFLCWLYQHYLLPITDRSLYLGVIALCYLKSVGDCQILLVKLLLAWNLVHEHHF